MRKVWIFAALAMTGCAPVQTTPSAPFDYGAPIDIVDAEKDAKSLMTGHLKDPYSAMWDCNKQMFRGSLGSGRLWGNGSEEYHGWILECNINAKNSYGAYAGVTSYQFLFTNGTLVRAAIVGLDFGATQVIYSR